MNFKKILKNSVSLLLSLSIILMIFANTSVFAVYRESATNRNIMGPTGDDIYYYTSPVDENGILNYYHYPIYDDPMDMSDEDFFGKWSEIENRWITTPLFEYSAYPYMVNVEEAAKVGDYETAKKELLDYYRGFYGDRVRPMASLSAESAQKYKLYLDCYMRGLYPIGFLSGDEINLFKSNSNEWELVSVDVTRVLKAAAGSYAEFNTMISAADKFYTTAEIYSRDGSIVEYHPVLKATVNGIDKEFVVSKDAMIRGGNYSKTNYGYDEILQVEEHGTYDNYTDATKRVYIAYDISELTTTDEIESARIEMYVRNNDEKYGFKELSLYWHKESTWTESGISWDAFTEHLWFSCADMEAWDYVTSNSNLVKGKTCDFHRDVTTSNMAHVFSYLKDERYAYAYLHHIMALINGIGFSRDIMNDLDIYTHIGSVSNCTYRTIDSEYMTPERFTAILKHLYTLSNWTVNFKFGTHTNNYATYATGGIFKFISWFPEFAVHDEWIKAVQADNKRMLGGSTFADGMSIELSINYIQVMLDTFSTPLSVTAITGGELPYDEETYGEIYNTLKTLMNSQGPYSGFNLADGYDPYSSSSSYFKSWYGYGIFDDPQLEYLATDGRSGAMPENATTNFPVGLRTYMRSGWDKDSLQLAITNNVNPGASHGHKDPLSLAMFAYGKYLLTDQGYGSLQVGDVMNYMKSPVQHNVVTVNDIENFLVDGTNNSYNTVNSTFGKEISFETNKLYDFVEYSTDAYTTTQLSQRGVLFLKNDGFWVVTDYQVPNDTSVKNLYAQHWHMYPGANPSNDASYAIRSNFSDVNVKVVPLENQEIDDVRYVDTYYSEKSGQLADSRKAMVLKTKDGIGRFTTVIMPMMSGEDINVESVKIDVGLDEDLVNAVYFSVKNIANNYTDYYYFYHLNDTTIKQPVKLGEYTTDATTLLLKVNDSNDLISVFMMDGSYLKRDSLENEYVIKFNENVESFAYKKTDKIIAFDSSSLDMDTIKTMTLYDKVATTVYYDGSTLEVNKQGGYLYFGDAPIIDAEHEDSSDKTEEKDENDRTQGVGGGSIGSGGGSAGGTTIKPEKPQSNKEDKPTDETPVSKDPEVVKETYKDVDISHWAFEAVEELTKNGIVCGDGTGKFNPSNTVKREEFVKMLLLALNIENGSYENKFNDVVNDSWYRDYVLTAKEKGIVFGIDDNKFGVGMNISRQDMAVMIYRIMKDKYAESNDIVGFSDIESVSDYAKTAVIEMRKMGIIEGFDNAFRPNDTLTRAEAVVIINRIIN